ncbi:MAG: hypothetical protein J6P66_08990 [Bacteroidaceae bacterium]|nr:hypothetical protein [Bacteroidaceae bacterium]
MFLLTGNISTQAQLFTPLGLGVEKCEYIGYDTRQQMHVEGDTLYVCTKLGLYSKDLSSGGSSWQLVGFENIPIQDYVRSGDDMLALISKTEGKYMLLSSDGGKTYEDVTPETFRKEQFINRLVQHPTDPNTLLVSGSMGLFQSSDFGQTWKKLTGIISTWIGYHPLNPEIIYGCGTDGIWTPFIDISYDGGLTWNYIELSMRENFVGSMAFHPTDPDIWIAGGARCNIFISTDNGHTWEAPLLNKKENELFDADWAYTVYDNVNSDIIYMAGGSYEFELMCSTDGGKTWNIPRTVPKIKKDEGLYDFRQYGDKLLIYTESDVYVISKSGLLEDTLLSCGFEQGETNYVISNKAVRPDGSADEVRIVTEEFHAYDICNEPDPNVVNYNYLEWKTGGNVNDSECKPGDASLTIGDFSLKAGLPYCLDYHIGSDVWGGNVLIGVFHRTAEGLVPVSGPMISPDGYLNNGMFFSPLFGYSSVMFYSNADYEDCCLRLSFVSPGRTFRLDNLTLSKNKMCNVLVDGDLARIEFAFPTNISDIAGAAPFGAVEVPSDYFSITGVYGQEPYVYDILGGEYHSDGRLYVWIEDDSFIGITNIRISFTNPAEETGLALKYIESISAETNDTVWRRVPDLVDLYAGDNSSSLSVSYMDYFRSCSLDRYIDGVPSDLDSIVVSFKKPLLEGSESRITARMENLDGNEEAWYADYYDKEYYSVVFRRHPSDKDKPLRGYCRFQIENVYYFEELSDHYTIPAYFGDRFDGVMLRVEPVHDSLASTITEHYSLDGRIIDADAPGLHIIRSVGGRVSKVLVK